MGVRTFPQRKQEARRPEPKSPHDHAPDDFSILPPGARPRHDSRPAQEPEQEPSNARSLFAEFFGTAALTTVAAGGEVIASISNGEVSHDARAIAPGLLVMALIYAIGDVSGAHVNPAVTLAFALRRDFPWRRVPAYWVVQIAGALAGQSHLE